MNEDQKRKTRCDLDRYGHSRSRQRQHSIKRIQEPFLHLTEAVLPLQYISL